jgi:hypothetical protein
MSRRTQFPVVGPKPDARIREVLRSLEYQPQLRTAQLRRRSPIESRSPWRRCSRNKSGRSLQLLPHQAQLAKPCLRFVGHSMLGSCSMARERSKQPLPRATVPDPYREHWISLTPAQRLRRSWRLRFRLRNLKTSHDAKTFPKF